MAADVQWIEEPHVLSISYNGNVSIEEMRNVIGVCVNALTRTPVHFLVDFTQVSNFDPHIIELSSLSEWLYHPNARWFAYVRLTGLYKNMLQMRHHNNTKFYQERTEAELFSRHDLVGDRPLRHPAHHVLGGEVPHLEARRHAAGQLNDLEVEEGIASLHRVGHHHSVAVLAESPARYEHALSLVELGAALRRAGKRAESTESLQAGMELAHQCGAERLVDRAREELLAAGAQPRNVSGGGFAQLTASERRIVRLSIPALGTLATRSPSSATRRRACARAAIGSSRCSSTSARTIASKRSPSAARRGRTSRRSPSRTEEQRPRARAARTGSFSIPTTSQAG